MLKTLYRAICDKIKSIFKTTGDSKIMSDQYRLKKTVTATQFLATDKTLHFGVEIDGQYVNVNDTDWLINENETHTVITNEQFIADYEPISLVTDLENIL